MQTSFSKVSDAIFQYFLLFSIFFLWLNFYSNKIIVVVITSLSLTTFVLILWSLINRRKKAKVQINKEEQAKLNDYIFQLKFYNDKELISFFSSLLSSHNIKKSAHSIEWNNTILIPLFNSSYIGIDDLVLHLKKYTNKKIYFVAELYLDECYNFTKKISSDITLLNKFDLFALMKKYNTFPITKVKYTAPKQSKLKTFKNVLLLNVNAKHYFLSGIIILVGSLFIKYSIYYLIFATILFALAIASKFKPQKNYSIVDEL